MPTCRFSAARSCLLCNVGSELSHSRVDARLYRWRPFAPCIHSLLKVWLLRQKQEGDAAVKREVSEARKRLEEGRRRWVNDVIASISEIADQDASFFRGSQPWTTEQAASCSTTTTTTTTTSKDTALLHRHLRSPKPEGESSEKPAYAESDPKERRTETFGWASLGPGVVARNNDASRLEQCDALSVAQEEQGGGPNSSAATLQQRGTTEGCQHNNNNNIYSQREITATAVEIESLAAQKRCARLESLAGLARQGLAAHWKAFFRDEIERTRMAAAAVDMAAERWVQGQREAAGVLWTSWRGRKWKSTSTGGIGSGGSDTGGGVAVSMGGGVAVEGGVCSATDTTTPEEATAAATAVTMTSPITQVSEHHDSSKKEEGASPAIAVGMGGIAAAESKAPPAENGAVEAGERQTPSMHVGSGTTLESATQAKNDQRNSGSGSTAAGSNEGSGDIQRSDDDYGDSSCVVVVRDVGHYSSGGQRVPSADEKGAPEANQLVVFVGRAMAFHTSTIRQSHMENFNEENRRRRCSSFSLPPQQGQQGQRYGLTAPSM